VPCAGTLTVAALAGDPRPGASAAVQTCRARRVSIIRRQSWTPRLGPMFHDRVKRVSRLRKYAAAKGRRAATAGHFTRLAIEVSWTRQ